MTHLTQLAEKYIHMYRYCALKRFPAHGRNVCLILQNLNGGRKKLMSTGGIVHENVYQEGNTMLQLRNIPNKRRELIC